MRLPQQIDWDQSQNRWAAIIEPFLNRITNQSNNLQNIQLVTGNNVIPHRLGRKLTGWYLTRINGAAVIYDGQDTNQTQDLTLVLVSDADVTISLAVF